MSADIRITRPPAGARREIVAIYEYWRSKAPGDGLLPARRHIDPTEIALLLPNVWLVDVVDDQVMGVARIRPPGQLGR